MLSRPEFHRLADIPPEAEWFANLTNPNTRRAYRNDIGQFMTFVGIANFTELRQVTRPHVIAWRKTLQEKRLAPATIRRKLSALSLNREEFTSELEAKVLSAEWRRDYNEARPHSALGDQTPAEFASRSRVPVGATPLPPHDSVNRKHQPNLS